MPEHDMLFKFVNSFGKNPSCVWGPWAHIAPVPPGTSLFIVLYGKHDVVVTKRELRMRNYVSITIAYMHSCRHGIVIKYTRLGSSQQYNIVRSRIPHVHLHDRTIVIKFT